MFGGQIQGVLYSLRWLLILDPSGLEENKTFSTGVVGVGRHNTWSCREEMLVMYCEWDSPFEVRVGMWSGVPKKVRLLLLSPKSSFKSLQSWYHKCRHALFVVLRCNPTHHLQNP